MYPGTPRPRRARPVAELPLGQLLARREELTKGWLLALLEDAPLDQAGAILAAGLVREGPRLCEGVLRALTDDEELLALDRGGQTGRLVFQAGELAGASDAEGAARAIDALGAVIWTASLAALPDAEPDQVARLAERLEVVLREVRAAAVRRYSASEGRPGGVAAGAGGSGGSGAGRGILRPVHGAGVPEPFGSGPAAPGPFGTGRAAPRTFATDPGFSPESPPEPTARRTSAADERQAEPPEAPLEPVQDELWVRALDEEIERSRGSGIMLALLLVELDEAERIRNVEDTSEIGASFGAFAQAMRTALRRRDILACETDTRAWVVARDTMRAGAQALGGRIAGAVQSAEQWRGAPLTVTVGVAVLGEDGQDREALMGAAEQDRFAAAASGTPVLGGMPNGEGQVPDPWAS